MNIVERIVNNFKINGPDYLGAPYPAFNRLAVNEEKIPHNMRLKDYDIDGYNDEVTLKWMTQEPFDSEDIEIFSEEINRYISEMVNQYSSDENNNGMFYVEVQSRDGDSTYTDSFSIPSPLFNDDDSTDISIDGITLLSVGEVVKIPESIRNCNKWWWLRSPGYGSGRAAIVSNVGSVDFFGYYVNLDRDAVRPTLIIPEIEDLDLEKYKDSIEVFDREWIYIGDEMVLAEEPIFHSRFDKNSNNYETSEIKLKLEDWLKEQLNSGN